MRSPATACICIGLRSNAGVEKRAVAAEFIDQHVPIQLEPRAIGAGRHVVLTPGPAMFERRGRMMRKAAGHHAVEIADDRLGLVAAEVNGGLLVTDPFGSIHAFVSLSCCPAVPALRTDGCSVTRRQELPMPCPIAGTKRVG